MMAALKAFQSRNQLFFDIEVVDVDLDAMLEFRYGDKVPVLLDGDAEICHYFLDETRLKAQLLNHA
jgi:Glutaredoxin-like domain (DUF836)